MKSEPNIDENEYAAREPARPEGAAKSAGRMGTAVYRVSWLYLIALVALWGFLRFAGDRWWLGTVILFGPVWVTVLPGALLLIIAMFFSRRSLWVLLPAMWIGLFPVMGMCIPWRIWVHSESPDRRHVRIMTCNIHGIATDKQLLSELINAEDPDVVLIQEWYRNTDEQLSLDRHYFIRGDGELYLLSRYPIAQAADLRYDRDNPSAGSAMKYDLVAPGGTLQVFNIHLASPHLPFQAVIDGEADGQARLERHLALRASESSKVSDVARACGGNVILAGDFNTPSGGHIFSSYWAQFSDAFATAGWGIGHTYFGEGAAVRIDHIMTGAAWRCVGCRVQPAVGSPHHAVVADFEEVK